MTHSNSVWFKVGQRNQNGLAMSSGVTLSKQENTTDAIMVGAKHKHVGGRGSFIDLKLETKED